VNKSEYQPYLQGPEWRATNVTKYNPPINPKLKPMTVRFDGGFNKERGPYGSYRVNNGPVKTIDHPDYVKTANQAEIWTFIEALSEIDLPHSGIRLCVYGDSQIALKWIMHGWLKLPMKENKKYPWRVGFSTTLECLYRVLLDFGQVAVKWQPREHNVRVFGH